jgi:hypothetical protein
LQQFAKQGSLRIWINGLTDFRVRCLIQVDGVELPHVVAGWRRDGRFLTGFSSDDADTLGRKLNGSGVVVLESEPATLKEIFLDRMGAA